MGTALQSLAVIGIESTTKPVAHRQAEVLEILEKGRVGLRTRASVTGGSQVVDGEALVIAPRGRT